MRRPGWVAILAVVVLAAFLVVFARATAHGAALGRVYVGANRGIWEKFRAKVTDAKVVRVYYDETDPATWPQHCPDRSGPGVWTILSMRPMPGPLFAGTYDAYFRGLFKSCTNRVDFAPWHEDGPANPLGYPHVVNQPGVARHMQRYLQALARGTHVRVGVIICAPANQVRAWMAPGLDWYGIDIYRGPNTDTPAKLAARLAGNLAAIRSLSGERYPLIRYPETNAQPGRFEASWFRELAAWSASHDGGRPVWMATFWPRPDKAKKPGGLSGKWPPSPGVVAELERIGS